LSDEFAELGRVLATLSESEASPLLTGWLAQARAVVAQKAHR
jgi:hypothetical protein